MSQIQPIKYLLKCRLYTYRVYNLLRLYKGRVWSKVFRLAGCKAVSRYWERIERISYGQWIEILLIHTHFMDTNCVLSTSLLTLLY
jgi:hypothetical protein